MNFVDLIIFATFFSELSLFMLKIYNTLKSSRIYDISFSIVSLISIMFLWLITLGALVYSAMLTKEIIIFAIFIYRISTFIFILSVLLTIVEIMLYLSTQVKKRH